MLNRFFRFMRYEDKIKELRETMLEIVPYLDLIKVKDTEEKIKNKYPDISEHFYSDFEKTLSNENELQYFIENLNPNESDYDKMVILNRLRLGLNTDMANEILGKSAVFLEWIDLCAQDSQFLDLEHYRNLMEIHFKSERYQFAIKSAEKYISLETDVKSQINGKMVILQSYYHLTGNLRMIDVIPIEETLFQQFALKGIEQADEILSIIKTINSNTEYEEYKTIAHICRCKIANILRAIDANNEKANAIIDEYRNGKCDNLKSKFINAIRFGIIRGDEYPEIERYLSDFSNFFEEVTKKCREENKEDYIKILCKSIRILEYLHVISEEELPLSYYNQ